MPGIGVGLGSGVEVGAIVAVGSPESVVGRAVAVLVGASVGTTTAATAVGKGFTGWMTPRR